MDKDKHRTPVDITLMLDADPLLKAIYDVVLSARTEGIVGGKTKWLALSDAEVIRGIIKDEAQPIKTD